MSWKFVFYAKKFGNVRRFVRRSSVHITRHRCASTSGDSRLRNASSHRLGLPSFWPFQYLSQPSLSRISVDGIFNTFRGLRLVKLSLFSTHFNGFLYFWGNLTIFTARTRLNDQNFFQDFPSVGRRQVFLRYETYEKYSVIFSTDSQVNRRY